MTGCTLVHTSSQLSPNFLEANQHRDALRFDDGAIVRVAMLAEGQRVKVLRLCSTEEREAGLEAVQRDLTR